MGNSSGVCAILLCAGRGERLGMEVDKPLVPLAGRPLFTWSLETFDRCDLIDGIVMVGQVERLRELLAAWGYAPRKVVAWCAGGRERQDSVARGLRAMPAAFSTVAVHDCARALVSVEVVRRAVTLGLARGAAIAAVPLGDTLKRTRGDSIEATLSRAGLWRAQTPQVFRRDWLEAAHAAAASAQTDDAALVEALGHPVWIAEGEPMNFKITTRQDLELAEAWLTRAAART